MHRTATILAVLMAVTPALAQDTTLDMTTECALQSEVVMQIVTARTDGVDVADAPGAVVGALSEETEKYAVAVPALVEWVYNDITEEQLGAAVGEAYAAMCLTQ